MSKPPLSGLYLIAGSGLSVNSAEAWLLPGVALVQYRNKHADPATQRTEAMTLIGLCRKRKIGLIINDDVELALKVGAHGVHLGKEDEGIVQARRALGCDAVIGASCYNSLSLAQAAQRDGADYVAFGALFASLTKPEAVRITLRDFEDYKRQLALPVCAIGGIAQHNVDSVLATGADLIAVHAAVAQDPDPVGVVRNFLLKWA